jgi:uncharacterized membrane protein
MSRTTKILALLLAISVAINVFILGFWAARLVRRGHADRVPLAGTSEVDRMGSLRGVWRKHGAALQPHREALEAARREVRDALRAEPFQPEALDAALTRLRAETGATQVELHRALVERARELGPEERRRLAESRGLFGGR